MNRRAGTTADPSAGGTRRMVVTRTNRVARAVSDTVADRLTGANRITAADVDRIAGTISDCRTIIVIIDFRAYYKCFVVFNKNTFHAGFE
jgi:hypothetical protein